MLIKLNKPTYLKNALKHDLRALTLSWCWIHASNQDNKLVEGKLESMDVGKQGWILVGQLCKHEFDEMLTF